MQRDQSFECETFRANARIYKVVAMLIGFGVGFTALPMMEVWDAGTDSLWRSMQYDRTHGSFFLLGCFTLSGILFSFVGNMFVRAWEYKSAPFGYSQRWW